MSTVLIVAIVFGSILTLAAMVCGTILVLVKAGSSGFSRKGKESKSEESKMIQEIYTGLTLMEQRIEALETILMDSQEKEKNNETQAM